MTTNPTGLLNLSRPLFNTSTWHDDMNNNMAKIDAGIAALGVAAVDGTWANSTDYVVGNRIYGEDGSTLWIANVDHTSDAEKTFVEERIANPTYWSRIYAGISIRNAWASGTIYRMGDIVYDLASHIVAFCIVPHTSTTSILDDNANWAVIVGEDKDTYYSSSAEASIANIRAGADIAHYVSIRNILAANVPVELTDAVTIAWDMGTGINFTVTLGAAGRTMANPTNQIAGKNGFLNVVQDGTGSRTITSWGDDFVWFGPEPTWPTDAGSVTKIAYFVRTVDSKVELSFAGSATS